MVRNLKDIDFDDDSQEEIARKPQTDQNDASRNGGTFKKLLETMTRRKFFKLLEHKLKKCANFSKRTVEF